MLGLVGGAPEAEHPKEGRFPHLASVLHNASRAIWLLAKTAGCGTGNARCDPTAALRITAAPLATAAITAAPRATAAIALPAKWRSSSKP